MSLTTAEIVRIQVPMMGTYRASVHDDLSQMESVLVVLHAADGRRGIGTADPSPGYSRQTPDGIESDLRDDVLPAVLDEQPDHPNGFREAIADTPSGSNAKAAAEMAFLDLYGRRRDLSVADVFGGAVRDTEPLNAWVGIDEPAAMAEKAEERYERGFRSLKLKLSGDSEADVRRVAAVCDRVGERMQIRADVNGAYDTATAIEVADELQSRPLVHLEQPVPQENLDGLARAVRETDVPIVADEPVTSLGDLFDVLASGSAERVKLKPLRLGGLRPASVALDVALAAGVSPVFGHGFSLSPAASAELQLAATDSNVLRPLESVGPMKMEAEPFEPTLDMSDGSVAVPDGPGLGVTLDDDALPEFETGRETVTR